jgi:beta-lactamase regulating signal transducer with metallopeptidase domain
MNLISNACPLFGLAAWPVLTDAAIKGIVLLAGVCLAVGFLRRASAAVRHLVWLLGLIGLLILPALSATLPGWRILPEWAPVSVSPPGPDSRAARNADFSPNAVGNQSAGPVSAPAGDRTLPSEDRAAAGPEAIRTGLQAGNRFAILRGMLVAGWAVGAALLTIRLLISQARLGLSLRRARSIHEGPPAEAVRLAKAALGIRRETDVRVDTGRVLPLVWGILHPRLLLPGASGSSMGKPRSRWRVLKRK